MVNSEAVIDIRHFNDPAFLDEFIDIFEDSAEDLLDKLEKSLVNNFDEFKSIVHGIKGLSGNIKAKKLREITTQVEYISEEEYRRNVFRYSKDIIDELLKVKKELAKCSSKTKGFLPD